MSELEMHEMAMMRLRSAADWNGANFRLTRRVFTEWANASCQPWRSLRSRYPSWHIYQVTGLFKNDLQWVKHFAEDESMYFPIGGYGVKQRETYITRFPDGYMDHGAHFSCTLDYAHGFFEDIVCQMVTCTEDEAVAAGGEEQQVLLSNLIPTRGWLSERFGRFQVRWRQRREQKRAIARRTMVPVLQSLVQTSPPTL